MKKHAPSEWQQKAMTLLRQQKAEIDRLQDECNRRAKEMDEVEQILGKIIGYPKLFPVKSPIDDGRVDTLDDTSVDLAEASVRLMRAHWGIIESVEELCRTKEQDIKSLKQDIVATNQYRDIKEKTACREARQDGFARGLIWGVVFSSVFLLTLLWLIS